MLPDEPTAFQLGKKCVSYATMIQYLIQRRVFLTIAMQKRIRLLLLLLCLAVLATACAKTLEEQISPKDWDLSSEASSTYYYLLLEDAKRQSNATIGEYALEQLLQTGGSPMIFIEAANFYWHQGDTDKTKTALLQGLAKFPQSQELELMLAQFYLTEKQLDKAASTINSYLRKNPDDTLTRQELADILIRSQQYEQAFEVLENIPEEQRTPLILYYLAKIHDGLGRRAQAIDLLQQALEKDAGLIEAWAELAYLYELERNFSAAEAAYTRMLEMGESSQELWLRLVDLNLKMDRPGKALSLTKQGPDELGFFLGAGTLFVDQGYYKYAEQIFLPLLKNNPESYEVYFYLALLAFKGDKDVDKAIDLLAKVPPDNRFYSRALRFRAHLLYERGSKNEAKKLAQEGRSLFPEDKDFWTLEASLYEDEGNFEQALELLALALKQWPDDVDLLFLYGVLLDKTDRKAEAMDVMERIVAQNNDHADALNYLGYSLADNNIELDRAYALIKKALQLKPDNGYIQDSLAWVYYRKGNLKAAWEEVQRAVSNAGDDPIIWEHYGDIAAALGHLEPARKGYHKALELGAANAEAIQKKLKAL